jgi:hypothetical protein
MKQGMRCPKRFARAPESGVAAIMVIMIGRFPRPA